MIIVSDVVKKARSGRRRATIDSLQLLLSPLSTGMSVRAHENCTACSDCLRTIRYGGRIGDATAGLTCSRTFHSSEINIMESHAQTAK